MTGTARLVGRAPELESFDRVLAQLDAGEPAAIELVGEPGIGKTRLLGELAARADDRGHVVLRGGASELERELPFAVFVDALDAYLQALDPRRLDGLDAGARAELTTVFPALASIGDGTRVAIQHERYRSHRAVRSLLEDIARRQPVALLLDDVHWADPASVELLAALLRRLPSAPVLLALGARHRHLDERLAAAVDRAHRDGSLERLELRALSFEDARELVGEQPDPRALYEETGGNPFYLEQLARTAEGGRRLSGPTPVPVSGLDVPPVVAAALGEELALLSAEARLVLDGASVAGDPFDPELAAAAAAVSEERVLDALDELLHLDLVRPTDVPRRFRFRHPLVRRAVYETCPGGRRLAAHARCADALAQREAPVSARAHHVELSAREGDLAAVELLRAAAEGADRRAPGSAAQWLGSALRLLPASAPREVRVDLLIAHSEALDGAGRFLESREALVEGLAAAPADDEGLHVRLTTALARVEHLLGRHEKAHGRLLEELGRLRDPDSRSGAALQLDLATDAYFRRDYDGVVRRGAQALATARRLDDGPLAAAAHAAVCLGDAFAGRIDEAERHRADAARLVDALDDDELARRLDAVAHLGAAELCLDRYEDAVAHLRRGLSVGRATGQGQLFPLLTQALAVSLSRLGRLGDAVELLDGAIDAARLTVSPPTLAWALVNRSWAAMDAGDLEAASAAAWESAELVRDMEDTPLSAWSASVLGAILIATGQPARGMGVIHAGAGGAELSLVSGDFRVMLLERIVDGLLAVGRADEADDAAQRAVELAADGNALSRAVASRARASVLLAGGAARPAAECAVESVTAAEAIGARIEAARSRTVAGRALAAAGDTDRACVELTAAADVFDDCGAIRSRNEAERELRKLGRRPPRRSRAETVAPDLLSALTARELEVARLVVERKTNPEIAAALFLSRKTVETHLRNMFRKLDVSSRVELARAVERSEQDSS